MVPTMWDMQQERMAPFLTTFSFQNEWFLTPELLCFRIWVKVSSALYMCHSHHRAGGRLAALRRAVEVPTHRNAWNQLAVLPTLVDTAS